MREILKLESLFVVGNETIKSNIMPINTSRIQEEQ